jgi:hypothetical protein
MFRSNLKINKGCAAAAAAAAAADIIIIITDIVVNTTHPKLMMWYIGCIDRP